MLFRLSLIFMLVFCCWGMASGQDDPDQITDASINYGDVITDTLTERSFYDFYRFRANAGDVIYVQMMAADGLAPLIGISGLGREIIARSDVDAEGTRLPDAEPNATIELEFLIPETGEYAIVPTRVGNAEGTTTGSYTLMLRLVNPPFITGEMPQEVTFRCGADVVINALTFDFFADADKDEFRISVYGFDGLEPVIRIMAGQAGELRDCGRDSQQMGGSRFMLPGGESGLVADDIDQRQNAAQTSLSGGELLDRVQVSIGAIEGTSGRYMVMLEGLKLSTADAMELMNMRLAPLTASTEVMVYMLKSEANRIDPLLTLFGEYEEGDVICDDAGRGNCADIPALVGAGVAFNDGLHILGDRFSAGLRLSPGSQELMLLGFSSQARSATGAFAVILIGEVPPRSAIN